MGVIYKYEIFLVQGETACTPELCKARRRAPQRKAIAQYKLNLFRDNESRPPHTPPRLCTLLYSITLWSNTLAIGSWLIASIDKAMSKLTTSAGVSHQPPHKAPHKLRAPPRPLRSLRPSPSHFAPPHFVQGETACTPEKAIANTS